MKATKVGNGGERAALAEGQADGGEFGEHVAIDKKGFIYLFGCPEAVWDLSSLTRDQTRAPCIRSRDS